MYGCYYNLNNLRFRNTQDLKVVSAEPVVV